MPPSVPTLQQYLDGLRKVESSLTPLQRALLIEHCQFPGHTCFAKDLAKRVGAKNWRVVNLQYALAAQKFADAINWAAWRGTDGKLSWWSVWSMGISRGRGRFEWVMHPTLVRALKLLKWIDMDDVILPQQIPGSRRYVEGSPRQTQETAYERSPVAREACIRHYGCRCSVCGMDFGRVYGPIGQGFIEVHHLRPLSEIGTQYEVDPVKDLRPVCPNCHAMLHRCRPPLEIEELKSLISHYALATP